MQQATCINARFAQARQHLRRGIPNAPDGHRPATDQFAEVPYGNSLPSFERNHADPRLSPSPQDRPDGEMIANAFPANRTATVKHLHSARIPHFGTDPGDRTLAKEGFYRDETIVIIHPPPRSGRKYITVSPHPSV